MTPLPQLRLPLIALVLTVFFAARAPAEISTPAGDMAYTAKNFLAALTDEQRAKATYELKDAERFDWHFIPKERKGLPLKEMTPAQQRLAQALLNSGLSQRGYTKAMTIMSLEQVLADMEKGKGPARDPERYFFTIFGQPGSKDAWGWRVEGHHISLNFVVRGDEVLSATPCFFGSNPGEVRDGPRKGLRVLGEEEDLGRRLATSLTDEQKKVAIISTDAPGEIITGNSRKVKSLEPQGLAAADMNDQQKQMLRDLLNEYVDRHRRQMADADLAKIQKAGFDKLHFAWAGALESGRGHYYRVQGPTFLLEYDNTQNNANHIHTVWRDFENDFGEDVLREHYDQYHNGK
ncbi:MAG TPA: DUF3500 domain-containing protein [Verrucomicrobiae bacterium]|nr:DUF3500 domain-containing protein [Verrucomicrobiae bacterium]